MCVKVGSKRVVCYNKYCKTRFVCSVCYISTHKISITILFTLLTSYEKDRNKVVNNFWPDPFPGIIPNNTT